MQNPVVSIVIPVYNEENYIAKCLDSIISQDYDKNLLEVLLVDGNSNDKTAHIIKDYTAKHNYIKLLKNEKRTIQHGSNIGIKNAKGEYIVRMDAHAEYANDYVSKSIEYIQKTGAMNVGGPTVVRGKTPVQKVIASSYTSPFALGSNTYYKEDYEGYSNSVSWGTFKREDLLKIGLYDERLVKTDDDDLNFRINQSGGKVFITPQIKSVYYPRDTYLGLFKQYFSYGMWKVAVIKKHKKPSRIVHLIPMLFVLFLCLGLILSLIFKPLSVLYLAVILLYLVLNAYFSFTKKNLKGILSKLRLFWVHIVLHVSYGLGFWVGIFKFWNW